MSQQIEKDNDEIEDTYLKALDTILTSDNITSKIEVDDDQQTDVVKKKSFLVKMKTNRFFLVRFIYYILFSVWLIAVTIAGLIAWIISMLLI